MKQWLETSQVFGRLADVQRAGVRAALATVVRVRGSAYRHEGAKMLIVADGATSGNVSGGCLEADVREVALQVLASRTRERREYCGSADEIAAWDLGVGCEGMVDVLIEPLDIAHDDVWALARASLSEHVAFVMCTDVETGARCVVNHRRSAGALDASVHAEADRFARRLLADAGASGIHTINARDVFFDVLIPPPSLVIASAGEDARHLARCAADVGFRVIVVDRRPALLVAERFPPGATLIECHPDEIPERVALDETSFAVVMNHNYADDREYVRALLTTPCAYIGMLGPRQRTDRIIAELNDAVTVDESRIYGPVGLDIGTDGAEQVAVAVVAEMLAVRSGRRPASLRERQRPIHSVALG